MRINRIRRIRSRRGKRRRGQRRGNRTRWVKGDEGREKDRRSTIRGRD